MPLYEYKCERCGDQFEVIQKFSDEPLTVHDKCGGPVHRLLSAPALQFKGSGWYITDYARSGGSEANGATKPKDSKESAAAEKSETKSESKSESKSGTTSESKTDSKPGSTPSSSS